MSPIHTAKESLARDLENPDHGGLPGQWKPMELPTHPLENELTFAAL
jgi:hypothetical protein